MVRRHFLSAAAFAVADRSILQSALPEAPSEDPALVDTNVSLGEWPIRHSWARSPGSLVAELRRHGVTSAWTSSFDGALHSDVAGVNARLAEACAREGDGLLLPFGVVNPTLPAWEADLVQCAESLRMRGIRLLPSYHGYLLDDARFLSLLDRAATLGLVVQIALSIEDDRAQNSALTAAPTQAAPLVDALARVPRARVMLLNGFSRLLSGNTVLVRRLSAAGVVFEIATLEGVAGIESLLRSVPGIRLAFGSHAPYFYFESALLKLQESALSPRELDDIRHAVASALLASRATGPVTAQP